MKRQYSAWQVETNGITTVLGEWGEGERHMVLLHGVSSNHKLWGDLALRLAGAGWHVYAPDFRGSGMSEASGDQVGEELDAYVDDLVVWTGDFGLNSFVLAGHSFGGRVAAEFAARFPDRVHRLVLIDPAGPDNLSAFTERDPALAESDEQGRQSMRDKVQISGPALDVVRELADASPDTPTTGARIEEILSNLDIDETGMARHKQHLASMLAQHWISRRHDQRPALAQITATTIVMRAAESGGALAPAIPHYADLIPNATFLDDVPGDHQLPLRNPEAVFEALTGTGGSN